MPASNLWLLESVCELAASVTQTIEPQHAPRSAVSADRRVVRGDEGATDAQQKHDQPNGHHVVLVDYWTFLMEEMGVMATSRQQRFRPEVRERAIRLVREQTPQHASQWAAISAIAPKLGCTKETLRRWVREAEREAGHRPGPTRAEEDRLKALEREIRELKRTNEILRKASAFVAAAAQREHSTASGADVRVHSRGAPRPRRRAERQ